MFQRQHMIEEVQLRQEILKLEAKKRRDLRLNSENNDEDIDTCGRFVNYMYVQFKCS